MAHNRSDQKEVQLFTYVGQFSGGRPCSLLCQEARDDELDLPHDGLRVAELSIELPLLSVLF